MKKLFASAVFLLATYASAATPSLAGPWTMHSSVSDTEWNQQCTFVLTDQKLTGTCKPDATKEVQITGRSDGKTMYWTQPGEYNGDVISLTYTATLDDSGKIKGSVSVQPYGVTGEFIATPAKEAAK